MSLPFYQLSGTQITNQDMDNEEDYGNYSGEVEQYGDIWQDNEFMETGGPHDDDFRSALENYQAFRSGGGGYGMNAPPRFFGPRGPPGQSGPRFTWGRGFGPAGPPTQQRYPRDNKSMRYLIRCGIPKQNLKGLPNVLLDLMEPQYCGVCAQGFDNFAMSRLHYICKNHMKNQKKWLSQQAEVGSHRPKEIPLKSRDLYCELCDVHITSKVHADSHYAGRPHRAIVEGRKNPKNPFLLQKGMKERVEQLIRREKKSLKSVEDGEGSSEVKKDSRPVQPDLYCNICKTSVTCTEQMTMHLNGKRHLTKEKQHILKMMKGETTDNQEKPAENDEGCKASDSVGGNGQDNHEGQDQYDWGNGSGTWDDDPQ